MLKLHEHDTGEILTVKQLNRSIRDTLEARFSCLWVEGEIADCKRASSGHIYLTLQDEEIDSQIRCAMFTHSTLRILQIVTVKLVSFALQNPEIPHCENRNFALRNWQNSHCEIA